MQTIKSWAAAHFKDLLIIALLLVLIFRSGCSPVNPGKPSVTITHDTVWIHHDSTVYSTPVIVKSVAPKVIPKEYIPDTNYASLKRQYEDLANKYLSINIQKDSLKIDSLGEVRVEDSVQKNQILARKWDYNLKERVVTNTVTIREPYKSRRQIALGGGVGIGQLGTVDQLNAGGVYKDRHDRMIGVSIGYNFPLRYIQYNLNLYKVLSLRGH